MAGTSFASLIPEVPGEIFYLCLPPYMDPRLFRTREARGLMRVCKHWRDVALGTPTFWTDIAMEFSHLIDDGFGSYHTPARQDAEYRRFCEQYMSRSHTQHICLTADWEVSVDDIERTLKTIIR